MAELDMRDDIFYGEWVEWENEEEKEQALQYLALWKRFFLKKVPDLELIEEQLVYNVGLFLEGSNKERNAIGIKLQMRGENPKDVPTLDDMPIKLSHR